MRNDDERRLEWALKSALYTAKNNVSNKYSYTKCPNLNMDGIDFPTPISQIPKVEKQNNLAINVYGATVSPKLKKVNTFPYCISARPNTMQRTNLLLISDDESTKHHCCWIDYSLTKTNVKIKPISVIDAYTVSPKKTY